MPDSHNPVEGKCKNQVPTLRLYPSAFSAAGLISGLLLALFLLPVFAHAQSALKKVRLALPTKSVSFLAFYVAHHKGFYKDEGIELEPIIMQPALASTAVLTGDIDYNGAVTGETVTDVTVPSCGHAVFVIVAPAGQWHPAPITLSTMVRPKRCRNPS